MLEVRKILYTVSLGYHFNNGGELVLALFPRMGIPIPLSDPSLYGTTVNGGQGEHDCSDGGSEVGRLM